MTTATLSATYTGATPADQGPTLLLEQLPVASGKLTADDLEQMLALVRQGISAKTYRPADCPATVVDSEVLVPVDFYVWPNSLATSYSLAANQGELGEGMAVAIEREFDMVVDFTTVVDLPFAVSALTATWSSLPCFDRHSRQVSTPLIIWEGPRLHLSSEVLGVLRIRCTAMGFLHTLKLRWLKGDSKIDGVKVVVAAAWADQTLTEQLDLPGCVEQLLAECEDGERVRERGGSKATQEDETIPVVYFNDCDGSVLALRYERP